MNISKEQIEHLYIKQGLSVRKCADALGLATHGSMAGYMRKYGIPSRPGKFQKGNKVNQGRSGKKHPQWKGGKQSVFCDACGNELYKFPSLIKDKNFCDQSCYGKWRSENFTGESNPNYGNTAMFGESNPNWKGGISLEPYCDAWKDLEYKEGIKARDGYECKNPECNGSCDSLVVHHVDYEKKNCHPGNLLTLCISCNARANFNREYWQELFTGILEELTTTN